MTLMKSGRLSNLLPAAGFEPVGRGQGFGIFGQQAGQAGENVDEVFLGVEKLRETKITRDRDN
jgi:hypothetical protein